MRKTRLVILPGVRSLNKIGCLLLFLACPTIAFKGQENREVEPLCRAQDLKEFWVQESPWPGDLGDLETRNDGFGSRPRLDTLTQHTCNVDAPNRRMRGGKSETQPSLLIESRKVMTERRETTRRLDPSVDSRSRSQDNTLDSRRSVRMRRERDETREEITRFSDERRRLDERRSSTYREDTRMVIGRERITREDRRKRNSNRLDRSNTRSMVRQIRSEDREERGNTDIMRQSLSMDRRSRTMENIRNDNGIRSQLQEREVRAERRRSEHQVDGRRPRREGEARDSRIERNSESRFDTRIRQEPTRSAPLYEVVRTVRERMDGGARRMDRSRRDQDVRNNPRDVRRAENRRNLGEMRVDRDGVRDSTLPAMRRDGTDIKRENNDIRDSRILSRTTRSIQDVRQSEMRRLDRSSRVSSDDTRVRQIESRRVGDIRRDTRSMERRVDPIQDAIDVKRENNDIRDSRILSRTTRSIQYMRQSEMRRLDRASGVASDDTRARQVESRRVGDIRRETRSMERRIDPIQDGIDVRRENNDIRDSRILSRTTRSAQDVRQSEMRRLDRASRVASDDTQVRQVESRRVGDIRRDTRSMERRIDPIQDAIDVRRDSQILSRTTRSVQDVRQSEMRRLDLASRVASDGTRVKQVESRRVGDIRRETRSMERRIDPIKDAIDVRRENNDIRDSRILSRTTRSIQDVRQSEMRRLERASRVASDDTRVRQVESRCVGDIRRDTRSTARRMDPIQDAVDIRRENSDTRDSRLLSRTSRSVQDVRQSEMRRLDLASRVASDDTRVRHVESRRVGDIRRDTRSTARRMDPIQDAIEVRRENNDIRDSRILSRTTRSVQDVRQSELRRLDRASRVAFDDVRVRQVESRRIGGVRRDTRSMERRIDPIQRAIDVRREENVLSDSRLLTWSTRSVQDVRRSDVQDQPRVGIVIRQQRITMRWNKNRANGNSVESRRMNNFRDSLSAPVQTLATRMESRNMLRDGRKTDVLDGRRPVSGDSRWSSTERHATQFSRDMRRSTGEAELTHQISQELRGKGESQRETGAKIASHDKETMQAMNRRVREFRAESRSMEREMSAKDRRMNARSTEFRDSRTGKTVRLIARDSQSAKDLRRGDWRSRIVSNERDTGLVDNRLNDEDRIRNMNQLGKTGSATKNVDDMRRSDRRVRRSGDGGENRRVENRRRLVKSLERETTDTYDSTHRRRASLDNKSSHLLRIRSSDGRKRSVRRSEINEENQRSRRSGDKPNSEVLREKRHMAVNMNVIEKLRTEMRRIQIGARNIRPTEGMVGSDRNVQLSRVNRDVRQVENMRSVVDVRKSESRRVNSKPVDARRTYSDDRDSGFAMKTPLDEYTRQSSQIRIAREEKGSDASQNERMRRDVVASVRLMKSLDDSRTETRRASFTTRSVTDPRRFEGMARHNPKTFEMRRTLKNSELRVQEARRTRIMEARDIYHLETKLARTAKPDSTDGNTIPAEKVTHKWNVLPQNAEQIYGMAPRTEYFEAAKRVVANLLATFDLKMTDVSRLGETVMYGGIVCYALFANVHKKAIF